MSFLVSFFNSSSARIESLNEAEYSQEEEAKVAHDADPSMNIQSQKAASFNLHAEKDASVTEQSPQFPTTQSEPSNYVHFQDSKPPSFSRGNPVEEAAARSLPMPSRQSFQGSRMRSLSKVFTSLPEKPLPSYAEMMVDQIEFLMHVILLETDPKRSSEHENNLVQAIDVFKNIVPNGQVLMKSGRLYSRMMLASLARDLIALSSKGSEGEDLRSASDLPSEGWKTIKERLISLKTLLLKQSSNAEVDFHGNAVIHPDTVDEELTRHEMMTVDFDEVILLLLVHEEIAHFKEQLETCIAQEEQEESTSLDTSQKSINKAVETCVNSFMKNLSVIFPPDESSPEDEVDDGIEIEEELDENWGRTISNIPKELHALALTELYSPKRQPQATNLVERLLADIQSITKETQVSAVSLPGRFSFESLLSKARSLLTKWSETVLQIPTLVQLGYGGVPSPFVFKDDDDVSSWGSEGENASNVDEKIVRSRSFSRILRASIHGRPVSVTAEEKDVIARLALIAESSSDPHSNVPIRNNLEQTNASVPAPPGYRAVGSNEVSAEVNSLSGLPIHQGVTEATKAPLSATPSYPAPDHQNFVAIGSTQSSSQGGRKVVKAGRRFLSSLSAIAQRLSDDANEAARSVGKKRVAEDTAVAQPAKVSRRNNIWALKQRKKVRLNTIDVQLEDAQTPIKAAARKAVIVEDDEGNIVHSSLLRSPSSSSIKRHPFTEDEVSAILEGVKLHGVGHWTVIQESDERLANRKPGQLKDKYRTMMNRGEV